MMPQFSYTSSYRTAPKSGTSSPLEYSESRRVFVLFTTKYPEHIQKKTVISYSESYEIVFIFRINGNAFSHLVLFYLSVDVIFLK